MKITAKRKKIIDTLQKSTQLLSARELSKSVPEIDQATVYRTLDLLVKENIAKKFVFEGTESVYEYAHANHHHAVCGDCEKVIHFHVSDKEIIKSLDIKDFDVNSVEIIVKGRCN